MCLANVIGGAPLTRLTADSIHRHHSFYCGGVGRRCGVGRGLGVTLGVTVAVAVGVAVGVTVGVDVGVAVGVGVGVGDGSL